MKFYLSFIGLLVAGALQAQTFSENLIWDETLVSLTVGENEQLNTISLKSGNYESKNNGLPSIYRQYKVSNQGEPLVTLQNIVYKPAPKGISINQIPSEIQFETIKRSIDNQPHVGINMLPIRKNPFTGVIEIVESFEVDIQVESTSVTNSRSTKRTFKSSSVLSNGNWFKIKHDKAGMHKLTYQFLTESLGIENAVSFSTIGLFGNGGGMVEEQNDVERIDDIEEIPIIKFDINGNGLFDDDDYIIYHAEGAHEWFHENNQYRYEVNIYSDFNYYFLTTDRGTGKSISTEAFIQGAQNTSNYDVLAIHELEETNVIQSGREFLGDFFSVSSLSKQFNFELDNLNINNPINIETRIATNSAQPSSFNVLVNNTVIHQHNNVKSSGSESAPFCDVSLKNSNVNVNDQSVSVEIRVTGGSSDLQAWLDYIKVVGIGNLNLNSSQLTFRNHNLTANSSVNYRLSNANSSTQVWNITNKNRPVKLATQLSGNNLNFGASTDSLQTFIAFNPTEVNLEPVEGEKVEHQNYHQHRDIEMVIVTSSELWEGAQLFKKLHEEKDGLKVQVVDKDKIFNEFSGGRQDVSGIRDYMKMLYDKASSSNKRPQFLMLIGDGSYNYKSTLNTNINHVPVFESIEWNHKTNTYVSDDYYGMLEDGEGTQVFQRGSIDVAIGRVPAQVNEDVVAYYEKVVNYMDNSFGKWRQSITFVADDEDDNLHMLQADGIAEEAKSKNPTYNFEKIYLDAFQQVNSSAGARYPEARKALKDKLNLGTLMVNYSGHGSSNSWAHERVLNRNDIQILDNPIHPVFVTATCNFSLYDNPEKISAGEELILNPIGGAIAMVSTVRVVFASQNRVLNRAFYNFAFEKENGKNITLGESLRRAKNSINPNINNRKFQLLGDPALKLAQPNLNIATTSINGKLVQSQGLDTVAALNKVDIVGNILNDNNEIQSNFNGILQVEVYDKAQTVLTLGNDERLDANGRLENSPLPFEVQRNTIFSGRASVTNGRFEFSFIVPKDINFSTGKGKLSYYASNSDTDAGGFGDDLIIGGVSDSAELDEKGPEIDLFINDEDFAFGGLTDENPTLLVRLFDENGINTSSSGVGHNIVATIDNDPQQQFILNNFYETELNSFKKGGIDYPLFELEDGRHSATVKAWDTHNNSAEGYTEFVVSSSANLALKHVLNYPNPFTTNTTFMFEHNKAGQELKATIQIFTVSGKLVKRIHHEFFAETFRVQDISWDGLDDFGDAIGRGVYVYKVTVKAEDGSVAEEMQKLVLLR